MDFYGFYTGQIFDAHAYLGAHPGPGGTTFRVFAPAAKGVGLLLPQATSDMLPTGQYFIRVTATNASGKTQTAQEIYEGLDEVPRYGVRMFYILPDGTLGGV